jgi:hypothetical protein
MHPLPMLCKITILQDIQGISLTSARAASYALTCLTTPKLQVAEQLWA